MSCHLPTLRRLALASALAAALATGCTPIQLQDDALQTASDALNAAQEMSPGEETQRFLLRSATIVAACLPLHLAIRLCLGE